MEQRRNFYLIFKEAVNNLVKYSGATRVAITLINENEFIKLRIQDDGVGDMRPPPPKEGIGAILHAVKSANCKDRH